MSQPPISQTPESHTAPVAQQSGLHRAAPTNTPTQIAASNSLPTAAAPTPLGKRPKGRLLVASVLFAILAVIGNYIYQSYFATIAYGSVTARVIRVSPPWSGSLSGIHVSEGQMVRQNDLLVTVDNHEIDQQLARTGDRLKIAQAELNAALVRLKIETELHDDRQRKSHADYFQLWGDLLVEKSLLADLQNQFEASKYLHQNDAVSDAEHFALSLKLDGQREKVEKLDTAVEELKSIANTSQLKSNKEELLKPKFVAIETLQNEIERLRKSLDDRFLHSPVNGQVVRVHHYAGERVGEGDSVIEVSEEGSLEIQLFVTQTHLDKLKVGQHVRLLVNSNREVVCSVERLGLQFQNPPSNLVRFFPSQAKVLPVYLTPVRNGQEDIALFIDSQVRLPRSWKLEDIPLLHGVEKSSEKKSSDKKSATSVARAKASR